MLVNGHIDSSFFNGPGRVAFGVQLVFSHEITIRFFRFGRAHLLRPRVVYGFLRQLI